VLIRKSKNVNYKHKIRICFMIVFFRKFSLETVYYEQCYFSN